MVSVKHLKADKFGVLRGKAEVRYDQSDIDGLYRLLLWIDGYEQGSKNSVPGKYALKKIYEAL